MTYQFADHAPPPWEHQLRGFELSRDDEYFALFMEQRTGKSRIIVDTAAYLYDAEKLDAVLIFAPNGVHANWVKEAFPEFLPKHIPARFVVWRAGKMEQVANRAALAALLIHPGLAVLTVNYDALRLKATKAYLSKFLRKRKILIAADESDDLSTPGAKRTITAEAASKWCLYRRILTGTPAAESPFGLYPQTNFLKPKLLGFDSPLAFKHHHAEWEVSYNTNLVNPDGTREPIEVQKKDASGNKIFKNLDELEEKLRAFSYRVTRAECGAQLPTHVTRVFALSQAQRTVYEDLRTRYRAELAAMGTVTAAAVLARYIRLQQVTSGFVPLDTGPTSCTACAGQDVGCIVCDGIGLVVGEAVIAELPNPRLDALEREIRGTNGQTVIWTRFVRDADAVMARLQEIGRRPGRFDGAVNDETRAIVKAAFMAGDLTDLVANPQAGGRGNDFSAARVSIFYGHYHSLRLRLQAQDRVENLNRRDPTTMVDLVAEDTIDETIVAAHKHKKSIQDIILGDAKWGL